MRPAVFRLVVLSVMALPGSASSHPPRQPSLGPTPVPSTRSSRNAMFPKIEPVRVLACQPPRTQGPASLRPVVSWLYEVRRLLKKTVCLSCPPACWSRHFLREEGQAGRSTPNSPGRVSLHGELGVERFCEVGEFRREEMTRF